MSPTRLNTRKKIPRDDELLDAAKTALQNAHAPYSRFRVGAAVRDEQGGLFAGCNIENASYGLTVCAERVAIFSAIASGARRLKGLAVVADGPLPPYPCGACRQVMEEFLAPGARIWVAPARGSRQPESFSLKELLPKPFER